MKKPKTVRKTMTDVRESQPRFTARQKARLLAMTEEEIEQNAREDPDNPPRTEAELDRAAAARRIRMLRERLGLSQSRFSHRFRIPVATLRDWEQARRTPDATSIAYLTVIERNADAVQKALED